MYEEPCPERISRLIADSLSGKLSPGEAEELQCWAERSAHNRQLLELLGDAESVRSVTGLVGSYDAQQGWTRVATRYRRRRIARLALPLAGLAAVAAVVMGIFLPGTDIGTAPVLEIPPIAADASGVRLLRASGEVIAMDTLRHADLKDAVVESDGSSMRIVALADSHEIAVAYNEVTVPVARQFTVTLEDGTRVMLNASSRLRFPDRFAAKGSREVYLSGEAYFCVQKDAERPFIVHSESGYVRVTGTEFNLSCYEDTPSLVATLVEGRVLVGSAAQTEVALEPGMQAVQEKSSGVVATSQVDVAEITAWCNGLFAFRERPLGEILESVARWYGCRVVWENPARSAVRFTGKIAHASSLDQVAGYFSHTGEVEVALEHGVLVIR